MNITKRELIIIYQTLDKNYKTDSVKFNYWINKNIKIISSEIESLRSVEELNEKIIEEYIADQRILFKKYGKQSGDNIIVPAESSVEFQKEVTELDVKHKDTLVVFNEKEKQRNEILDEETEVEFMQIKYELLPEKNLTNLEHTDSLSLLMKYGIIE